VWVGRRAACRAPRPPRFLCLLFVVARRVWGPGCGPIRCWLCVLSLWGPQIPASDSKRFPSSLPQRCGFSLL